MFSLFEVLDISGFDCIPCCGSGNTEQSRAVNKKKNRTAQNRFIPILSEVVKKSGDF